MKRLGKLGSVITGIGLGLSLASNGLAQEIQVQMPNQIKCAPLVLNNPKYDHLSLEKRIEKEVDITIKSMDNFHGNIIMPALEKKNAECNNNENAESTQCQTIKEYILKIRDSYLSLSLEAKRIFITKDLMIRCNNLINRIDDQDRIFKKLLGGIGKPPTRQQKGK